MIPPQTGPIDRQTAYQMGLHDGTKDRHFSACPHSAILRGRTGQMLMGNDYADNDPSFVDDPRLDAYYQGYNEVHQAVNAELLRQGYDSYHCPCGWKAEEKKHE